MARFQIKSYSRFASLSAEMLGTAKSVGRMASWASWAPFDCFPWWARGVLYSAPYFGGCSHGELAQVRRVRTHVGDVSGFVEVLGHPHGPGDAEPQLAGGLLLQGGRGERGSGLAGGRPCFDRKHRVRRRPACFEEVSRCGFVRIALVQLRFERNPFRSEFAHHAEGRFRSEGLDLALPLHEDAHGDGLHAARGKPRFHPLPQDGAQVEADQPVEDPACLLRIHEVHVHLARPFNGLQDGVLRDF